MSQAPRGTTLALFHPHFRTLGGAEILVATQAQYLKRAGVDLALTALTFDERRWQSWFEGIEVRVVPKPPLWERLAHELTRIRRAVPRVEACLAGARTVMACNYPTNVMLGASSIAARRTWCCTEPSRDLHLAATNPRLHQRVLANPRGETDAERDYAVRLKKHGDLAARAAHRDLVAFDVESTKKIDAIYAISEFARDNVRRVYDRHDAAIIYPVVRFRNEITPHRAGLDRTGLKVLTHSRLEIPKNVDNVIRAFALYSSSKHPGAELHVVGQGQHRPSLEALATRLGIAASVRFHGYLSDEELARVYAACDVYALTPLDEPFGMVFPEAAARGLLLVGPDHGGPFEIIDGGRLGWACDPFEPQSMADAFARIASLDDDEVDERRRLADAACRARYAEEVIGPQLVAAIG
ncbi:MAG TPA: glycosyltransferase family 4 protein [Polyangiaceae bacterium]|nr:glycosyltransferase family 4 protein [Polyangiaceae bacterium]